MAKVRLYMKEPDAEISVPLRDDPETVSAIRRKLKKLWHDPVWSKVIASAITATVAIIIGWVAFYLKTSPSGQPTFTVHLDGPPQLEGSSWKSEFRIYPDRGITRAQGTLHCTSPMNGINMGIAGFGLRQGVEKTSDNEANFGTAEPWGPKEPLYFIVYTKDYANSCDLKQIDAR